MKVNGKQGPRRQESITSNSTIDDAIKGVDKFSGQWHFVSVNGSKNQTLAVKGSEELH